MYGFDASTWLLSNEGRSNPVTPQSVHELRTLGPEFAWLGYDSADVSLEMLETMLGNGMTGWAPYRFLNQEEATYGSIESQVDNMMMGTHQAINAGLLWPVFVALDVEIGPNGLAPSIDQVVRAMDRLEQTWDITPDSTVKPAIYSAPGQWKSLYPGWTEPGRRRYWGIEANWNGRSDIAVVGFGGIQVFVGHQYNGTRQGPFGGYDPDWFEFPTVPAPILPAPPQGGPIQDVTVVMTDGSIVKVPA